MRSWKQLVAILFVAAATACAAVQGDQRQDDRTSKMPPGGEYQKVSDLVALPDFIPGMGTLYVQPDTLPVGPFLAYDREGRLVSTVYMVPLGDMQKHKNFQNLQTVGKQVVATDIEYNAGHPGVEEPHYHVVLWHVPPTQADLE